MSAGARLGGVPATAAPGERDGAGSGRVARNATLVAVAEVLGKVATLAFTVAAARTLSRADFGAFAYALSFSLLVATLPSWGFDPLLVRRASGERRRLPALLSETLLWRTAIAVPVFLAAAVAGFALRPSRESAVALVLVLAATLVDLYSDAGRSAAGVLQDQAGVSRALVVQRVSAAVLAVLALGGGLGLVGLSGAYLAASVIGLAGVVRALRGRGVRLELSAVRRAGLARTARLSVPLGITAAVSTAVFRVDQIILEALRGDDAVGLYAAAYRLLETVLFVSWAVARAVFPAMSADPDPSRVRRGVERGAAALAWLYVPFGVGLWLEARPLLELLYGPRYGLEAAPIARWLAPAPMLFAAGYLAGYGLLALDRRWRTLFAATLALAANVGLNLALVPSLAGTGAAVATTASYALETAVMLVLCRPLLGWIRFDRSVALPAAAGAGMAVVLALAPLPLLPEIVLGGAVYVLAGGLLLRRLDPEMLRVAGASLPRLLREWRAAVAVVGRIGRGSFVAAGSLALGAVLAGAGARFGLPAVVLPPLAAVAAIAAFERPALALALVFGSFPVAFASIGIGPLSLQVVEVAVLAAAGLVAARRLALGLAPLAWTREMRWAAAALVAVGVAAVRAPDLLGTVKQVALLGGAFVLVLTVLAACRSMHDTRVAVGALLAVGAGIAVLALDAGASLRAAYGGAVVSNRAAAMFAHANDLGAFASMLLMVSTGVVLGARRGLGWALAGAVAVLAFAALALSLSRGAWIGALVGAAVMAVLARGARRRLAVVGVAAVAAIAGFALLAPARPEVEVVVQRVRTIVRMEANPYDARPVIWREALRQVAEAPLTGHGPGRFRAAAASAESAARGVDAEHAHSLPLTIAAEAGLPALALVAGFAVALGAAAWRAARRLTSVADRALAAGLAAAVAAQLGQGIVDFNLRNPLLLMLVAALAGMILVAGREAAAIAAADRVTPAGALAEAHA